MKHNNHEDTLAVVIPVWNLAEDLTHLLAQLADLRFASEIIVVDDASDTRCDPAELGFTEEQLGSEIKYLRTEKQMGAGFARNKGIEAVSASNVIFMDADDRFVHDFTDILASHRQAYHPDFTIFRHIDARILQNEGRKGSFQQDEKIWSSVLGGAESRVLRPHDCAQLAQISAYPWNKIYRTDFLKENAIRCSETPVHNDIRLHWLSFLHARHVLCVGQIGVQHEIGTRNHHLTQRRGPDRFCVEEILVSLREDLRKASVSPILMRSFLRFTDNVCRWNIGVIEPELQNAFTALVCRIYTGFTTDEFAIYAAWQPEEAEAIVGFLLQEHT